MKKFIPRARHIVARQVGKEREFIDTPFGREVAQPDEWVVYDKGEDNLPIIVSDAAFTKEYVEEV